MNGRIRDFLTVASVGAVGCLFGGTDFSGRAVDGVLTIPAGESYTVPDTAVARGEFAAVTNVVFGSTDSILEIVNTSVCDVNATGCLRKVIPTA